MFKHYKNAVCVWVGVIINNIISIIILYNCLHFLNFVLYIEFIGGIH